MKESHQKTNTKIKGDEKMTSHYEAAIPVNDMDTDFHIQENTTPKNQALNIYIYSDILSLCLGLACSWLAAYSINGIFFKSGGLLLSETYTSNHILSFLAVSSGLLLWFGHNKHYKVRMPFWTETQKIINALGFALLVDGFLQFASKHDISRVLIISSWIFSAFIIIALRAAVRKAAIKRGSFQLPTLLIGTGTTAQQIQAALKSAPEMGYAITAQIKNLQVEFLQAGSSWKRLCEKFGAQHVIIALDGKDLHETDKIMEKLAREPISFSVAPPLQNLPVTGMVPHYFMNNNNILITHSCCIEQRLPQIIKRSIDIAVSGSALIVLSPIMLFIACMVKMDGGSALFGHKRLGFRGKIFPCMKFRTMVMGGDAILKQHLKDNPEAAKEWAESQKLLNDPRVTRFGKFLRSTSLDELPQLINVLRGDMSLVGPRPIVRDEIGHYKHDITHYYRVRPGVTGLWQVSGRSDVSYAQRVQMDSWYVKNWSLWHDIAIMCKTFPAVFKRSGAY